MINKVYDIDKLLMTKHNLGKGGSDIFGNTKVNLQMSKKVLNYVLTSSKLYLICIMNFYAIYSENSQYLFLKSCLMKLKQLKV